MVEIETLEVSFVELPIINQVEMEIRIINDGEMVYEDFYKNFMLNNSPCVIKNVCGNWKAYNEWVLNNEINCKYFIQNYGDFEAPVADCEKIDYNAQCKFTMEVKEFMEYLKHKNKENLLYLKDWHLKAKLKQMNVRNDFYKVPEYFASDWLNEYAEDNGEDDFQFVYIGPKDSWTPLHADVYTSYSWSVNIVGKKKWVLFPPGEEDKLRDSLGNLPILFNKENYENIRYLEVIQERGDAIFVPTGWHHQVLNLYDTISINHNFINSCNIEKVWNALQKNLSDVEKEIEEFKDSPEYLKQCQLILKSIFGMNFKSFMKLIMHIAEKRLNQINSMPFTVFDSYNFGKNHIIFDLHILYKIFNLVENHALFNNSLLGNILSQFHDIKDRMTN
ncbi:2-oxoglutarate and iron-dependent oxygenase JMJD4 [Pieris brassicae]|uniref:2-oxoglutarate and iron-dependent oxygenase JMJD4 n=1 Tax=Pieris brassicae TaxID=7116 RepID=UPI001E65EED4|nr:2-oxoglutarate and iron-dependent oxygenase JMJD4 [Pieris brassicae]